jgi:phosphonopyruvate decarboxylase
MLGSMGLASSFGLGIALNSEKKVFILDGDGSALMDMGAIATIADCAPVNLVHIVLDNQSYQSTGGQPTISDNIPIDKIAKAAGYKEVLRINNLSQFKKLQSALNKKGPLFILIKVNKEGLKSAKRINIAPDKMAKRLQKELL